MELRDGPLPGLVEFFLDSALEEGEIDGCTYMTCRLYGYSEILYPIADGPFEGLHRRLSKCDEMAAHADDILAKLPVERRLGLLWEGAASIPTELSRLATVLAYWAIGDEVEGGYLLPFKKPRKLMRDGSVPKGIWRRCCSPRWIHRYIKNDRPVQGRRKRCYETMHRVARFSEGRMPMADNSLHEAMMRQMARRTNDPAYSAEWSRVTDDRILRHGLGHLETRYSGTTAAAQAEILAQRKRVRLEHRNRKHVLKRAVPLAIDVLGKEPVRDLAQGKSIMLMGTECGFLVRPRTSLAMQGHGGLSVELVDTEHKPLASLCVYYKDTPVIDQVTALALEVKSGLEREIVATANVIQTRHENAWEHPVLAFHNLQRHTMRVLGPEEMEVDRVLHRHSDWDRLTKERNFIYWAKTGDIWIRDLTIFCVGAKAAPTIMSVVKRAIDAENRLNAQPAAAPRLAA